MSESWLRWRSSGRGGCVPYNCSSHVRSWCSLRYWNRRVRRCIKMQCLSSSSSSSPPPNHDNAQAEQPSAQPSLSVPEITIEDLDALLANITAEVQCLSQSSSSSSSRFYDRLSHWEQRNESLTTFMKSLPNQVVEPRKDLLNVLLIKVIGGVGQMHWLGLGLSLIVWSLENINLTTQNYKEGLEILGQTVRLLRNTKQIWEYIRSKDGSPSYVYDLQQTVEKAFQCAIICTSDLNDNYIQRFFKALNVQGAITALKEDLSRANFENVELMVRYKLVETSELERQPVYSNTHDKDKVGDSEVANEAMTFLKQDCNEIIAVWLHGMGGVGKSSLGLEIFNQIQDSNLLQDGIHYKECRVELEFGIKPDKLIDIQKQILEKVSGGRASFSNTLDGKQILGENLKKIKEPIFLYLDNILKFEDLVQILPEASCFPPKSRILVTSRFECSQAGIEKLGIRECKAIEVRCLQENLARELLWKQITSIEKHMNVKDDHAALIDDSCKKLEEEVLKLCGGLPLALIVVGRYIASGRNGPMDARIWEDVVDSMQKAQSLSGEEEDELFSPLMFSIKNLNEVAKKAFLDMVSFYDVDDDWRTLKCLVGRKSMKVLKERALVQKLQNTSSNKQQRCTGKIHDLLRAIGKKMIQEDKNEPRIAGNKEFDRYRKEHNNAHLEKVVALKDVTFEACLLKRMPLLRFLKYVNVIKGECPDAQLRHLAVVHHMHSMTGNPFNFRECASLKAVTWGPYVYRWPYIGPVVNAFNLEVLRHEKISKGLEILRILNWPKLENVDAIETFGCLRELVIEYNPYSNQLIKCLPEGIENLIRLRELCLENLAALECLPKGITSLTCLKRLSLDSCDQLQSLPEGISRLQGLKVLQLSFCKRIRSLGEGIAELKGLTDLGLRWCESLEALPEGVGNLTGLTDLDLEGCESLQALPQGVANLTGLTSLQLDKCDQLQYLPEVITRLHNLKIVSLSDCHSLTSLPKGFFGSLHELSIDGCHSIASIAQDHLTCLQCLSKLRFSCAREDTLLPPEISMLTCSLTQLHLVGCQSLQSIDGVATLVGLTCLSLSNCNALQSIEGITALVCLRDFQLWLCNSLQQLPQGISRLTNLTTLEVSDCKKFRFIPEGIGSLTRLTELILKTCRSLESIPQEIGSLKGLTMLYISECTSMPALPDEVTGLSGLRYLHLPACKSLQRLPDGLSKLSGLMGLDLYSCENLQCLPPMGLSRLTGLTWLNLSQCNSLQCLPAGISSLTGLRSLRFRGCKNLESLPQEIATMGLVQYLDLSYCSALQALPGGVAGMRGLKEMYLTDCTSLESLPQGITTLSGLESLDLRGCTSLKALPQGIFSSLIGLKELDLSGCTSLIEPQIFLEEICSSLTCLESLRLKGLEKIQVLAQGLASMISLEHLSLSECTSLKSLPQGISCLTHLQKLDLTGCKSLLSLPKGITKLAVNCEIFLDGCPAGMPL